MKCIGEVSEETGLSIDTLRYYEKEGLVNPTRRGNKYREYSDDDMDRIKQITFFRALDFSISEIKDVFNDPDYDREKTLNRQIELLEEKKQHFENMISVATMMRDSGQRYVLIGGYGFATIDECANLLRQIQTNQVFEEMANRFEKMTKEHLKEEKKLYRTFSKFKDCKSDDEQVQLQISRMVEFYSNVLQYGVYWLFTIWSGYGENDNIKGYIDNLLAPSLISVFLQGIEVYLERMAVEVMEGPCEKLYESFDAGEAPEDLVAVAEPIVTFWKDNFDILPLDFVLDSLERIFTKAKYDDAESKEIVMYFQYLIEVIRLSNKNE